MLLLPSGFLALLDLCDALHRTAPRNGVFKSWLLMVFLGLPIFGSLQRVDLEMLGLEFRVFGFWMV